MSNEAQPLIDFREVVEELNHFYRDNSPYFTIEEETVIEEQINGLMNEFKTLFKSLTGDESSNYHYDVEGDTVMEENRTNFRDEKRNETEPYEIYDEKTNLDMTQMLSDLMGAYPYLREISQSRTILTSDAPNADRPTRLDENAENRMSFLLYARNRSWVRELAREMNEFYPLLTSTNDQTRELWAAYGRKIIESNPTMKTSTEESADRTSPSVEMNFFDTLFQPLSVIDYSPQEIVVAVSMEKLVSFYRGLVRQQLRSLQRQLGQSERERNAEQMRYETLLRETREGEQNLRELKDNLTEKNKHRQKELTDTVMDLHRQEIFANKQAEQERNKLNDKNAYRNFLTIEYLRREEAFLRYLVELLERRRNNKHMHRMKNAKEFFATNGFNGDSLIKSYLKKRDQVLREIYGLDYDHEEGRDDRESKLRLTNYASSRQNRTGFQSGLMTANDRYAQRRRV